MLVIHQAQRAKKAAEICDKMATARVFALCEDGSVYKLEDLRMKPGFKARECNLEALLGFLREQQHKSLAEPK